MKEFRKAYFRESGRKDDFKKAAFHVWGYRGLNLMPKWKDVDSGEWFISFFTLSRVPAPPRRTS
jgi:hypothetical protein